MKGLIYSLVVAAVLSFAPHLHAQSTSQDFPTPVTTAEINGTIRARDIGDARLTTYFYTFGGDQGDLFLNVVSKNFTGDIDVFTAAGLRPVTKIVIYAAEGDNETGRAVYFRKTEKLLLRVQGRSPNDDPATFRIKFAGSFVAARESDSIPEPELPKVNAESLAGIRVNSAGTILPQPPRPAAAEKEVANVAKAAEKNEAETRTEDSAEKASKGLEINGTEGVDKKDEAAANPRRSAASRRRTPPRRAAPKPGSVENADEGKVEETPAAETLTEAKSDEPPAKRAASKRTSRPAKKPAEPKEPVVDPLASIHLVIDLKNGRSMQRAMNEVFRFSVDKGILTVILKDGSITRYPIVEVAKVTIQ